VKWPVHTASLIVLPASAACAQTHTIDLSAAGTPINKLIRGQNARCGTWTARRNKLLDDCRNMSKRVPPGRTGELIASSPEVTINPG
jgi:hypothetical protein